MPESVYPTPHRSWSSALMPRDTHAGGQFRSMASGSSRRFHLDQAIAAANARFRSDQARHVTDREEHTDPGTAQELARTQPGNLLLPQACRKPACEDGSHQQHQHETNELGAEDEWQSTAVEVAMIRMEPMPPGRWSPDTLADFIAMTKKTLGSVTYGSSGTGRMGNLAGEFFASLAGIKLNHIPYKGAGGAVINDLVSGQLDMTMAGVAGMRPLAKAGKLRILAVGDTKRRKRPAKSS